MARIPTLVRTNLIQAQLSTICSGMAGTTKVVALICNFCGIDESAHPLRTSPVLEDGIVNLVLSSSRLWGRLLDERPVTKYLVAGRLTFSNSHLTLTTNPDTWRSAGFSRAGVIHEQKGN